MAAKNFKKKTKCEYTVTSYGGAMDRTNRAKFPKIMRAIIVGPSNCGKTTLLMNFIYKDWLIHEYLYIFSKSLNQPLYIELLERYSALERELGKKVCFSFNKCDDMVPVDECYPDSLVVFDDCLLEKQHEIKNYFTRGRHKNISCIYLSQCYNLVDRQVIRNNVNMVFIFRQNKHYLKNIYDDFVGSDMTLAQFSQLCNQCWDKTHGFLMMDLSKKRDFGKYQCQLNEISLPTSNK